MLGQTGCRNLAGMVPEHGKHCDANSVSYENSDSKRRKHSANQHNRRNQPIPHKALGYDTTKAAPLLSQTESNVDVNNWMHVYEAGTVWRIEYSEYWSKKVALR
jgi:hypothetical protein